jgi:Uncharacterized protein conserved in bacteria
MKGFVKHIVGAVSAVLIAVTLSTAPAAAGNAALEKANKEVVIDFYTKIFVDKNFEAAKKHFGDRYIQHNPGAPDGPEALEKFLTAFWEKFPNARSEIKRVFADGDYVILHVHAIPGPGDPGLAIVDIFRLEAGKVVEHWDVVQKVPPTSANSNTMF